MKKNLARFAAVAGVVVLAAGIGHQWAQAAADPSTPTYTGCLAKEGSNKGKLFAISTGSSPTRACTATETQVRLSSGDITSVAGGQAVRVTSTELGVPDTNGSVSLDLAPQYKLPQSCSEGQVVKRTGAGWACQSPLGKVYLGRSDSVSRPLGDNWSVLGDGMDLPAGAYAITAKVVISRSPGGGLYRGICRLDATGDQGIDNSTVFIDEHVGATIPVVMVSGVQRAEGFRISVVCRDHGDGLNWTDLRISAVPVAGFVDAVLAD